MILLKAILVAALIYNASALTCNYNLIWFEPNSTEGKVYQAKSEVTDSLKNAEKIEVKHKIIIVRDMDFSFAQNLKTLVLQDCGINDFVVGSLKKLPPVQNLTITHNDIKTINAGVFNHLGVELLNLSSNKIQILKPEAFDNMKNLTTLILADNELRTYAIDFENCPKISKISMRLNFIEEITDNAFKSVRDRKLTVDLSFNNIRTISRAAFDVKEFKVVLLDHNELKDANILIKLLRADKVDLSENHIECIPKEFMENGLSRIKMLNLTSNPLNCSCLNDLKKKVKKNVEFQKMSPLVKNPHIILPEKNC